MATPDDLPDGAKKLLVRIGTTPLDVYWGRRGWCPCALPKGIKRADFDALHKSGLVRIELGQMLPAVGSS